MDFTRLFEILEYQQQRFPQQIALAGRERGTWRTWGIAEIIRERDRLSAGLLRHNFQPGERVGLLTHCGSPQWAIADAALLQLGLVTVPIHATARPDEISHIIRDAGLRACLVSNAAMLAKLRAAQDTGLPVFSIEKIAGVQGWEEICTEPTATALTEIAIRRAAVQEETLATLLYTSGTTGLPKGVMLSHRNIVSNIKSVLAIVPVDEAVTVVSFLPLSHIFERMVTYVYQAAGASVWYAEAAEQLPKILPEVRPHLFTAVPRVLERIHERLLDERNRKGFFGKKTFDWALALGEDFPAEGYRNPTLLHRLQLRLADLLLYRRWRRAMGGRLRHIVVGAAALQPRLGRLFSAAGIAVREGYGLSETSPVVAFNRFEPGGVHFGTVGIPAPGVEVRISANEGVLGEGTEIRSAVQDSGEIEVRGPNIMLGYWNLPDETAARFTSDGWLKTGDMGHFLYKRFLKITGRRSEIFKTTSGKFVAPAFVEEQLLQSPYIEQCLALGLNQPYVGALIVPNFATLEAWCKEHKVHWTSPQFMILNPKVEKLYRREVERINTEHLGTIEKVRAFRLLHEPWTSENGLLTPTLKLRREVLTDQFQEEIAGLFRKQNV